MAEFCYACYKSILKGGKHEQELVLSKEPDLCEGCGEYKPVVIAERTGLFTVLRRLFWRK